MRARMSIKSVSKKKRGRKKSNKLRVNKGEKRKRKSQNTTHQWMKNLFYENDGDNNDEDYNDYDDNYDDHGYNAREENHSDDEQDDNNVEDKLDYDVLQDTSDDDVEGETLNDEVEGEILNDDVEGVRDCDGYVINNKEHGGEKQFETKNFYLAKMEICDSQDSCNRQNSRPNGNEPSTIHNPIEGIDILNTYGRRVRERRVVVKKKTGRKKQERSHEEDNSPWMTIKYFQRSMKKMFDHVIQNMCNQTDNEEKCNFLMEMTFEDDAWQVLYDAVEKELDRLLTSTNMCAKHGKRVTLMKKDIDLVKSIMTTMLDEEASNEATTCVS